MKTVASRYDEYVSVKDLTDKINRALAAAKKDNDFIYHDRVPEVKDLEHIGKAVLVKATAITPPLSQKFAGTTHRHFACFLTVKRLDSESSQTFCVVLLSPDLFEKMVPMAVQQSMSVYSQRRAETVNRLVGTMREATNLCNGYAGLCVHVLMVLCLGMCTSECM